MNGYSNEFWGWGAEDDDMFRRIKFHKLNIIRPKKDVARLVYYEHKLSNLSMTLSIAVAFNYFNFRNTNLNFTKKRKEMFLSSH